MNGKKMILGKKGVAYGLQVKGNQTAPEKAKPSIFGGFAGEDDLAVDRNAAVRAQQGVKRSDAKVKQMQAAALLEDANCFDYDSFYDDMQEKRKQEKVASYERERSGPRYLASMMAARDQRQKMRDIIYEKQEALAAKADAEIYGDKEQFATSAYKKKLQEDKLFAEQMEARDKADESKTVETQGMDGYIGILQSTLAKQPEAELAGEGQESGAQAQEPRESTGHAAGSQSFESMMEKKKRLKLEEKMATMDKYERKRFELEQGIAAAPSRTQQGRAQSSAAKGGEGSEGDGPQAARNSSGGRGDQQTEKDSQTPKGTASGAKRTAEDKIAAARERAKQRRTKQ